LIIQQTECFRRGKKDLPCLYHADIKSIEQQISVFVDTHAMMIIISIGTLFLVLHLSAVANGAVCTVQLFLERAFFCFVYKTFAQTVEFYLLSFIIILT